MTKTSQRSAAAAAALLLVGAGLYWRQGGSGGNGGAGTAAISDGMRQRAAASPTAAERRQGMAAALRAQSEPEAATPKVRDRFADCPILEDRKTTRTEKGIPRTTRLRLVRQDDFKYPIVRVVDELAGDRLERQTAMVGDHVLIKLVDLKVTEAEFLKQLKDSGASIRRKLPSSGTWLVAFANPTVDTVPKAIAQLSGLKNWVQYAEPDYIVHALEMPNDTGFNNLWGMHNTGQSGGVADADIDAPEAWNLSTGTSSVVVAVIDSGIDWTHPDLADNLWVNPGEIAANGVDDDGNGYVDDVLGWDFVQLPEGDNDPFDDNSHGTHCAGTIGAVGGNSTGVAGVCWDVSVMALKFLNASGNGSLSDGVEAIAYATNAGVTLTSNSWGGGGYSQAMKDVIDEADAAGILFVAAAGNESSNMDFFPGYPASYTSPNVISVAALTRTDGLADYSNFGFTTADLGAPGSEIYSTLPGGGYGLKSGTSMAAPHVAGACALLKAYRPLLQHQQVRDLILQSADPTPALAGKTVTGARLNLFNAMLAADDVLVTPGTDLTAAGPTGGPFTPFAKTFTLSNHSGSPAPWTAAANQPWVNLSVAQGTLAPAASIEVTVALNNNANALLAGNHTANITFTNPATGRTQLRQVTLWILPPPLYSFDLEFDPGWTRMGEWDFGQPLGSGGGEFGKPDPESGASGANVFGINLNGNYATTPGPGRYLVAGPFDLSAHQHATLRFQRWLNSDYQPWVDATVEVSNDSVTWHPLWDNGTTMQSDGEWKLVTYDLSAHADGQSQVFVRWGHRVRDSEAFALSGWNIDDVEILAVPKQQMHLTLPPAVTEGGSGAWASLTIHPAAASDMVVELASNRPGEELTFPPTVLITAGHDTATFIVSPLEDSLVDGTQGVTITASSGSFPSHSASMSVHDNEAGQLSVILPANATEGAGTGTVPGEIRLDAPADAAITVSLTSSDVSELIVPATVTIPQGELSAVIPISLADDEFIDGSQVVTVTGTVTNWAAASNSMEVLDNEPRVLSITLPAEALEGSGVLVNAGTVRSAAPVETDLLVNLNSSDTTEATVPVLAIIPARTSSAFFSVTIQNDATVDGSQTTWVNAMAPSFVAGTAAITVHDDETPAMPTNPVPANGATNLHPDTDLAWQVDSTSGGAPVNYDVYLSTHPQPTAEDFIGSTSSRMRALPRLNAGTSYYWQIVARKGSETRPGPVWLFQVAPVGPAARLAWHPIPSAVGVGAPFNARITAYDQFDNVATSFTDSAALRSIGGGPDSTTGTGNLSWDFPLATFFHDARTQSIYLPAEAGPAGAITSMALDVTVPPDRVLKTFTIRLKHTTRTSYTGSGQQGWETSGWTTVYQQNTTISSTGLHWFVFTTPFTYDGTSNLMVDICFNNTSFSNFYAQCRATPVATHRSLYHLSDSNSGDPLNWGSSFPTVPLGSTSMSLPNLKIRRSEISIPITPEVAGPFVNGTWSGELTFGATANLVRMQAQGVTHANVSGVSDAIDVISVPALALDSEPPFTGGTTNTISWAPTGTGHSYEVEQSLTADFTSPVSSGVVTASPHAFGGLIDGRTYHYRGRSYVGGVAGPWSAATQSAQDATPPELTFNPPSGGIVVGDAVNLNGQGADATSGIAALTFNGEAAASGGGFSAWQWPLADLPDGVTTLAVLVQDRAVPPNVRALNWTVTRVSDIGADADRNGINALMEYAFGAGGPASQDALPRVTPAVDPLTQERCLDLSFRRRLNATGLDYVIELSSDLTHWVDAGGQAEELSVSATGDNVTEIVAVRVHPPVAGTPCFVRVRVAVP